MLFTLVIFNRCEFTQESLANAKLARLFFMPENGVVSNTIILNQNGLLKFKNNFLVKEFFFTPPPTEKHSFQNCFNAINSYALFFLCYTRNNQNMPFNEER